jgi:protein O-GlcNAc transferase
MVSMKLGRNDPCSCGSGKKYKNCCLGKAGLHSPSLSVPTPNDLKQLDSLFSTGRYAELENHTRSLLKLHPNSGAVWKLFGLSLQMQGKDALSALQKTTELLPNDAEAHGNLAAALRACGQFDAAIASSKRALQIRPDFAEAHNNLGVTLRACGQLDAAIASSKRALQIKPDFAEAHNNLGVALQDSGRLDDAVASFRSALKINPDFADAYSNLGGALKDLGQHDDAVASFRRALEIKPSYAVAYSNLLFTMNYHPDLDAEAIYRAYQEFDVQRCIPLRSTWRAHDNDRSPDRRLRVGYVSPDFRHHSCRLFLEPLLAHHDKTRVEIYAYAELVKEDDITARFKNYVEHWIPTRGMNDDDLAERIRADGIDILVELAGHTAGNRLLVFARKPAPVSFSWLGYGYTTGLSAIDYYLTDEISVPAGSEGLFAEQPWRIATPAYAYRPKLDMGEVGSLPAQQRGYITFGTLTRSVRVNHRTIRVWAELLKAVPNSRLVMDSANFKDPAMQERMEARFAAHGIGRERLEIGYHSPPWDVLRGIDIGLDCFPHNSGTTLFETLYMGVPYITLADRPSVGRIGSSILHGTGHPEWIARTEDEYVRTAVSLASDLPKLAALRTGLRKEMEAGPLMDEPAFARKMEEAYRQMWLLWCKNHQQ